MQVPVADVEHVRDHVAVAVGDRVHLREDLRELRTRNDGIVEIVVRTDARERWIAELARLPQQLALGRRGGRSYAECAARLADRDDGRRRHLRLFAETLDLDEQQRPRLLRQVRVERRVHRLDRRAVEHLHRGRHDAARDDLARRACARLDVAEQRDERACVLGEGKQAHPRLGDDAECPFTADDEWDAVVAGEVRGGSSEDRDLAVGEDHLDAEDVIGDRAVAKRVRTAGVRADVPADRRHALARRVRREEEAGLARRGADLEVGDAGLHQRRLADGVDREHPPEPRRDYDHRAAARDRSTRQTGSRTARHDRDAIARSGLHTCGNLLSGPGDHDGDGRMAIEARVVLEHAQVVALPENVLEAADRDELGNETLRRGQAALRLVSAAAIAVSMIAKSFASSSWTFPWNARRQCWVGQRFTCASLARSDSAAIARSGPTAWSFLILNRHGYVSPVFSLIQIGSIPSKYGDVMVAVAANDWIPVRYQQTRSPGAIRSALRRWRLFTPCCVKRSLRVRS